MNPQQLSSPSSKLLSSQRIVLLIILVHPYMSKRVPQGPEGAAQGSVHELVSQGQNSDIPSGQRPRQNLGVQEWGPGEDEASGQIGEPSQVGRYVTRPGRSVSPVPGLQAAFLEGGELFLFCFPKEGRAQLGQEVEARGQAKDLAESVDWQPRWNEVCGAEAKTNQSSLRV